MWSVIFYGNIDREIDVAERGSDAIRKANMECELLKKGVFWYTFHHFGRFIKRLLFSHGLLVILIAATIALICNGASKNKSKIESEMKNDKSNQLSDVFDEKPNYCIYNIIEVHNSEQAKEKVVTNVNNRVKSKRVEHKNKRNECSVVK